MLLGPFHDDLNTLKESTVRDPRPAQAQWSARGDTPRQTCRHAGLRPKMREFMNYITNAFYGATNWSDDNTYKELNATARGKRFPLLKQMPPNTNSPPPPELIDFPLPRGLRLTLSSLATSNFATSYQLGTVGIVDGSISYLYSTVPLAGIAAQSDRIPLQALLRSYRQIRDLGAAEWPWFPFPGVDKPSTPKGGSSPRAEKENSDEGAAEKGGFGASLGLGLSQEGEKKWLLYGRLYLPQSLLEGLVVRRVNSCLQVQLAAVSERSLRNGGTILGLVQYDRGKYGVEGLASTDGGLLGIRGLYNFGGDTVPFAAAVTTNVSQSTTATQTQGSGSNADSNPTSNGTTNGHSFSPSDRERDRIYGRFSIGGELYYGTLNKSGGMSVGARFQTLPAHRGTPLTATLTLNPLMGNISATYAVRARDYCSLATRMEFNVYSYESDWAVGMELWSNRRPGGFLLGRDPRRPVEGDVDGGESARAEGLPGSEQNKAAQEQTRTQMHPKPWWMERSFQAKLEWRLDEECKGPSSSAPPAPANGPWQNAPSTLVPVSKGQHPTTTTTPLSMETGNNDPDDDKEQYRGVLKARLDQNLKMGLLWEGRVKSLIFSLGTGVDLRKLGEPFRSLGLEVQYSS